MLRTRLHNTENSQDYFVFEDLFSDSCVRPACANLAVLTARLFDMNLSQVEICLFSSSVILAFYEVI